MNRTRPRPIVLTIAGFDPSGDAGIIADIRTIESLGCRAVAAVTSVTFQNAENFFGAIHQTPEAIRAQIESIVSDHEIAAVKIGMLPTAEVVSEVARLMSELKLAAPVIDPVMESTTGGKLMADVAFETFVTELLPLARVVTPNIPEAEKLAGMSIDDEEEMRQAAARIRELGARAVLIKGGHLREQRSEVRGQTSERGSSPTSRGPHAGIPRRVVDREGSFEAIDVLDYGSEVTIYRDERIDAPNVRGTGCMLSSAIAAGLAKGASQEDAVAAAKQFVTAEIESSKLKIQN